MAQTTLLEISCTGSLLSVFDYNTEFYMVQHIGRMLSGRVTDSETDGLRVPALLTSHCCALEPVTLIPA